MVTNIKVATGALKYVKILIETVNYEVSNLVMKQNRQIYFRLSLSEI